MTSGPVGVADEDRVTVQSRRGTVQAIARVYESVPPGTVFIAFHSRESPANMLT
jgi:anaerobic selenocysteine-containing dehydrogenase